MALLSEAELAERIERLAAIERPSASHGERYAAELICAELRGLGLDARLEEEPALGGYWWPIGLATGAAALAGVSRSRAAATLAGVFGAAAVADDITGGRLWFRRRLPGRRTTTNMVCEAGDPNGRLTLVFVAHHDAAHSGLVFHPAIVEQASRHIPHRLVDTDTTPPTLWGAFLGPLAVAAGALAGHRGARLTGAVLSAGYAAAMADIGLRQVVPGANDNLTAVAVILSLAHSLVADPVAGVRVLLVSTGSEESFMEGMQGFGKRHFGSLPRESTRFVCIDTVGSPHLAVLRGEGMLGVREYDAGMLELLDRSAEDEGVWLYPNLRFRNATDALISLKAGYPTATLGSVTHAKAPANYHWPTDLPENLDYGSVAHAARICRRAIERLGATSPSAPSPRGRARRSGSEAPQRSRARATSPPS